MFRKIARPMLASVYIADGVDTLVNTESHSPGAESVLRRLNTFVPQPYSSFIPRDPELVARAMGAVKVAAGSTLALGKAQRLSAAALAVASVPTIIGRYAFWESKDSSDKADRRTGFLTSIGLLGGLLITVSDTQGKPGVVWRTKHAAKVTNKKVHAALPGKSDTERLLDQASDKAGAYADQAKTFAAVGAARAGDAFDRGASKASDLWEDKGRDFLDEATSWASDTFHEAQSKASQYYEAAADFIDDNKDDWLGAFSDNAAAVKHKAVVAAQAAQDKADHAADVAAKKAGPYRKKAKKASKQAAKARKKALKKLNKKFDI